MNTFGWSYPPGVSGNEFEIAGPDWEDVISRDCTEEIYSADKLDIIGECDFSGDVDASGYGYELWWTCPKCGSEHTEEPE